MQFYDVDEIPHIVVDNGSGSIKAGFAGEDTPTIITPTVIGRPRHRTSDIDHPNDEFFIGSTAIARKEVLSIHRPMEHGIVTNWDDMEMIWHYIFQHELRIESKDRRFIISEAPLNPKANRERIAQVLFERFNAQALSIATQGHLSFYAMGRTVGIILEIGDGVIHTMPINEGYPFANAVQRLDFGGRDITDYLIKLLLERSFSFSSTAGREIVRDMKEKLAYVSQNYEQELYSNDDDRYRQENYTLPDGQTLTINKERFRCVEALFQPKMIGLDVPGIARLLFDSIDKCDSSVRKDMYVNCILSGGGSMLPGLSERLKKEMEKLVPYLTRVRIVSQEYRDIAAWIGGSIVGSLSSYRSQWILKSDYEEYGPSILHRKYSQIV